MSATFAVIDTNIFLHFQPFDQINWPEVLEDRPVTLVVPAAVVRELDWAKDSHSRRKIQDRARSVLQKIERSELGGDEAELPDNVDLVFKEEPTINLPEYSLQESIDDDRILATCIELNEEHPDARIVLVTDDTTPRLKASRRDIESKEVPEKYRLPPARGELEKENRRLKQEIQKLENRLPKLELLFQNGGKHSKYTIEPPTTLSEEEIENRITELKEEYPPKERPSSDTPSGSAHTVGQLMKQMQRMSQITPPEREFKRYNSDREDFFQEYKEYLRAKNEFRRHKSRTVRLDIRLSNEEGTAPAEDIDVTLHFPDGLDLLEESDLPQSPEEPEAPRDPQAMSSLITPPAKNIGIDPDVHYPTPRRGNPNVSSPRIEETKSYRVSFHVRRLKHNHHVVFDPLFIVYETIEEAFSFSIDYRIHTASLPEERTGELSVIVND